MGENTSNPVVELVKAGSNVLDQFYQDLAQPSVRALGEALGTVFELCPTSLLSLKIWTEKRKLNFKKRLNEYAKKLEDIPEDKRCEVDTQIGTPIVEKLTYTTNDEIADLFTTLLANASNIETVNRAHPAFVEIIARLSPDEARIIECLSEKDEVLYCSFRGIVPPPEEGFITIQNYITLLPYQVNLDFPENITAYISNLVSIGILQNMEGLYKSNEDEYNEICKKYKLEELKSQYVPETYRQIQVAKGFYEITPFGKLFINACVKK